VTSTGSLAVILNRPSDTSVRDVLPQWEQLAAPPKVVFVGGPVKPDAALCLATLRSGAHVDGVPGLRHIGGRSALLDLDADPAQIAPLVEEVRTFAGYAGWPPDALNPEIERNDWIVHSASDTSPVTADPTELWTQVLHRT
jgi:putative transcriptional regulator